MSIHDAAVLIVHIIVKVSYLEQEEKAQQAAIIRDGKLGQLNGVSSRNILAIMSF